jgi:hypothetical protein
MIDGGNVKCAFKLVGVFVGNWKWACELFLELAEFNWFERPFDFKLLLLFRLNAACCNGLIASVGLITFHKLNALNDRLFDFINGLL